MLNIQNIEKKKLIIYIAIITVIIFIAIGFFVYKNYLSAVPDNPIKSDNILNINQVKLSKTQNDKKSHFLDNTIFNNPKFRALQNNFVTPTSKINIGKKNPFKPY